MTLALKITAACAALAWLLCGYGWWRANTPHSDWGPVALAFAGLVLGIALTLAALVLLVLSLGG